MSAAYAIPVAIVAAVIAGVTLLSQLALTAFHFTLACPSPPGQSGAEPFPTWSWAPPGAVCVASDVSGGVTPSWIPIIVLVACTAVMVALARRGGGSNAADSADRQDVSRRW